jgi:hypothetical protein
MGPPAVGSAAADRLRGNGFEVSHPCEKNKNLARMGHPTLLLAHCFSAPAAGRAGMGMVMSMG